MKTTIVRNKRAVPLPQAMQDAERREKKIKILLQIEKDATRKRVLRALQRDACREVEALRKFTSAGKVEKKIIDLV